MIEIPWQQARYLMAEHKTVYLVTGDRQSYELPKTLVYWEELLGEKSSASTATPSPSATP